MKILQLKKIKKTEEEDYIAITFKTWYGKEFTELCITQNWSSRTIYAKNGKWIPMNLWNVVKGFIRTNDEIHKY